MKNSKSSSYIFKNSSRNFFKLSGCLPNDNVNRNNLDVVNTEKPIQKLKEHEKFKKPEFLSDYEINKKIKNLKDLVIQKTNFIDNYNKTLSTKNSNKSSNNFYKTHSNFPTFSKPFIGETPNNLIHHNLNNIHFLTDKNEPFLTNIKNIKTNILSNQGKEKIEKTKLNHLDRYNSKSNSSTFRIQNNQDSNKLSDHTSCIESNIKFEKIAEVSHKRLKSIKKIRLKRIVSYDISDQNIKPNKNSNNFSNEINQKQTKDNNTKPKQTSEGGVGTDIPSRFIPDQELFLIPKNPKEEIDKISSIDIEIENFTNQINKQLINVGVGSSPRLKNDNGHLRPKKAKSVNKFDINKEHKKIFNYEYKQLIKSVHKKRLSSQTDIDYDLPQVKKDFYFMKSTVDFLHEKYLLAKTKQISDDFKENKNRLLKSSQTLSK